MNLTIKNLFKTYPDGTKALNGVNLDIAPGMFGLLGPNGAGKSSLMRTIATLQDPDEGSITLGDIDVLTQKEEVRKALGYLPQIFGVYPKVSCEDMLEHMAVLKGVTKGKERRELVMSLLKQVNLYDHRKKKLGGYSGGMKQRFGIAQALLGNPKLIIVDEPTAGLDPAERVRFLNLLSEIGENIIIILSTHIVEDVSELCREMAIIDKGQVKVEGKPLELIQKLEGKIWEKTITKTELAGYKDDARLIYSRLSVGKVLIHLESDENPGADFKLVQPDLRDVYFSTLNGSAPEPAVAAS